MSILPRTFKTSSPESSPKQLRRNGPRRVQSLKAEPLSHATGLSQRRQKPELPRVDARPVISTIVLSPASGALRSLGFTACHPNPGPGRNPRKGLARPGTFRGTFRGHTLRPSGPCELWFLLRFYGAPGVIRTPDLLVRSQTLYPAELRAHGSTSPIYRVQAGCATPPLPDGRL
jgi:hypothetical protein